MQYLEYLIGLFYDGLENFFKSFTIVSGRATLRVLAFSGFYLMIAVIGEITELFTFIDIKSAALAFVFMLLINCISNIQRKDIEKFKKLLKGDEDVSGS